MSEAPGDDCYRPRLRQAGVAVLDWNEAAIRSYEKLGAAALSDWTEYRLAGDALKRLAVPGGGDLR